MYIHILLAFKPFTLTSIDMIICNAISKFKPSDFKADFDEVSCILYHFNQRSLWLLRNPRRMRGAEDLQSISHHLSAFVSLGKQINFTGLVPFFLDKPSARPCFARGGGLRPLSGFSKIFLHFWE